MEICFCRKVGDVVVGGGDAGRGAVLNFSGCNGIPPFTLNKSSSLRS